MGTLIKRRERYSGKNKILDRFEAGLQKKVRHGDLPYLGLFRDEFKATQRIIRDKLKEHRQHNEPTIFLIDCLHRWPALFGAFLTSVLAEQYGQTGTKAVYAPLEDALGFSIPISSRKALFKAFLFVCHKLRLPPSPQLTQSSYMVRLYLSQAGVPLVALPRLVKGMYAFAKVHGIPCIDDDEAITAWQQHYVRLVGDQHSTWTRDALLNDGKAYYSRWFLSAWQGDLAQQAQTQGFLTHFEAEVTPLRAKGSLAEQETLLPSIRWDGDHYGLFLPPRQHEPWLVKRDDQESVFYPERNGTFVPLTFEHFQHLTAMCRQGTVTWTDNLWPEPRGNRFLVFPARGGDLIARGKLFPDQKADHHGLQLEPGKYIILSEFLPDNATKTRQVSFDPEFYVTELDLVPGEVVRRRFGRAAAVFTGTKATALRLQGTYLEPLKGRGFYQSAGMYLSIDWDETETADEAAVFRLVARCEAWQKTQVIDPGEDHSVNLDFTDCPSGMRHLVLELRRDGSGRPEARQTALVWVGLQAVKGGVAFIGPAANFAEEAAQNCQEQTDRFVVKHRHHRTMDLAFIMPSDRIARFRFALPGLFLSIRDLGTHSDNEQFVPLGSDLSLQGEARRCLTIYYHAPAQLRFGDDAMPCDFERKGRVTLNTAALTDALTPGDNQLWLIPEQGEPVALVRWFHPHVVVDNDVAMRPDEIIWRFTLREQMFAFTITLENLLTGKTNEQTGRSYEQIPAAGTTPAMTFEGASKAGTRGVFENRLVLAGAVLEPGVYRMSLEGLLGPRWGPLVDQQTGCLTFVFVKVDGHLQSIHAAAAVWHANPPADQVARVNQFLRLHRLIATHHAASVWERIKTLTPIWHEQLAQIDPKTLSDEVFCQLVRGCLNAGARFAPSGRLPHWNPAAFQPMLFAQAASRYRKLPAHDRQASFSDCRNMLYQLGNWAECDLSTLVGKRQLHTAFWVGFENVRQAQANAARLNDFRMARYQKAMDSVVLDDEWRWLRRECWQPGEGDYLGPHHLRYALATLGGHFSRQSPQAYPYTGQALHFATQVGRMLSQTRVARTTRGPQRISFASRPGTLLSSECDHHPIDQRQLAPIHQVIALLAKACRLEPREPGMVAQLIDTLTTTSGLSPMKTKKRLGYLLYLGFDLFGFYLMFWELIFRIERDGGLCE